MKMQNKANLNKSLIMGSTYKRPVASTCPYQRGKQCEDGPVASKRSEDGSLWFILQNKPKLGRHNHENTKQTQTVAQSPSAVVIHPGPKGRPNLFLLPFTFLLFVKTNPIIL
jgi:hypothetical protein